MPTRPSRVRVPPTHRVLPAPSYDAPKREKPAGAGFSSSAPSRADDRTRTGDPFITSEVLYQLSYVGGNRKTACKTW